MKNSPSLHFFALCVAAQQVMDRLCHLVQGSARGMVLEVGGVILRGRRLESKGQRHGHSVLTTVTREGHKIHKRVDGFRSLRHILVLLKLSFNIFSEKFKRSLFNAVFDRHLWLFGYLVAIYRKVDKVRKIKFGMWQSTSIFFIQITFKTWM